MSAENHSNPCLHIKDRQDIWLAISRVAGCHLPRCLACGVQLCQMGIKGPQDAFQEASEVPKRQGQTCSHSFFFCFFLNANSCNFMEYSINFPLFFLYTNQFEMDLFFFHKINFTSC